MIPTPSPQSAAGVTAAARGLSDRLPDLLIEARRIAANVALGQHGRRRAGPGETFWQFRPYSFGEPVRRIDWRRSARDQHMLYVREREWEAVQTAWLWCDTTVSMAFAGRRDGIEKRERAFVLTLALAELLARGGERVGVPGLMRPRTERNLIEQVGDALLTQDQPPDWPQLEQVRAFDEVVLLSDLLRPTEALLADLRALAGRGARVHLMQVLDPVEEAFPFEGRIEFLDPESGADWTTDRAGSIRGEYQSRLAAHREAVRAICSHAGWNFTVHHTDHPASQALLLLVSGLGGQGDA